MIAWEFIHKAIHVLHFLFGTLRQATFLAALAARKAA